MLRTLKSDPIPAEGVAAWSQGAEPVFPWGLPHGAGFSRRNNEPEQTGGEALDLVFIDGLTGTTVIGIHESELHQPQPLVIDVCAGVPRALACSTDRIGDTIDYGELRRRLLRLLAEHQVKLLEAFAEQVADIVLQEFQAQWVRVRVAKPNKYADTQALGVIIERRRRTAPLPLTFARPSA